jgi:hypothetical protein
MPAFEKYVLNLWYIIAFFLVLLQLAIMLIRRTVMLQQHNIPLERAKYASDVAADEPSAFFGGCTY